MSSFPARRVTFEGVALRLYKKYEPVRPEPEGRLVRIRRRFSKNS
jgi:hypothetical protein